MRVLVSFQGSRFFIYFGPQLITKYRYRPRMDNPGPGCFIRNQSFVLGSKKNLFYKNMKNCSFDPYLSVLSNIWIVLSRLTCEFIEQKIVVTCKFHKIEHLVLSCTNSEFRRSCLKQLI